MDMRRRIAYWLHGGTETCHACAHRYVRETEYRCVDCDRGVCAHCGIVERETHEVFCPDCRAEHTES